MKSRFITFMVAILFAIPVVFFSVDGFSGNKKFHIKEHKEFRKNCKECHSKGKQLKEGVTVKGLMATPQCQKCHKK